MSKLSKNFHPFPISKIKKEIQFDERKQGQRKKPVQEFQFLIFVTVHGRKLAHFLESTGSDKKKLISNATPETKKHSNKFLVNLRYEIE